MSAKIDAITQVSEHADGTWWAASMRAINHLAKTRATFTADDVLELVEAQGYRTKENRAMGGVMRHAQTKGIIEIAIATGIPMPYWTDIDQVMTAIDILKERSGGR